jgi:hypothetical protein
VPENVRITDVHNVLGDRTSSLNLHFFRRVVVEQQWARSTSPEDYLSDLRMAIVHNSARIGVYMRRGGNIAIAVAGMSEIVPERRRGIGTLPMILVIYSADRGAIVSGYQFSDWSTVAVPGEIKWLT